jgi:hypothetical protein
MATIRILSITERQRLHQGGCEDTGGTTRFQENPAGTQCGDGTAGAPKLISRIAAQAQANSEANMSIIRLLSIVAITAMSLAASAHGGQIGQPNVQVPKVYVPKTGTLKATGGGSGVSVPKLDGSSKDAAKMTQHPGSGRRVLDPHPPKY